MLLHVLPSGATVADPDVALQCMFPSEMVMVATCCFRAGIDTFRCRVLQETMLLLENMH